MWATDRHHAVCFYDHDDQLTGEVVAFLARALGSGGTAIVVATAEHRRAFEPQLWPTDRLVMLDAAEALERFMVEDRPDRLAFDASIGELVRSAEASGPVHVYGEMVAVLWQQGLVAAALELEGYWNDLGERSDFSLLCGYARATVAGEDDPSAVAFGEICRLHSLVAELADVGTVRSVAEASRAFGQSLDAPREARHFVTANLDRWGWNRRVGDLLTVASELATNAVIHAQSDFVLTLTRGADRLRIAVTDQSPLLPAPRQARRSEPNGRGLLLVAALSDAWGTDVTPSGKTVWAEVAS
jgi:anti-sigma regulatory factor (Ser/Thr protein kinase)